MEPYRIEFKPSVERDLRRLPGAVVDRVLRRIDGLSGNPFPRQSAKLAGAVRIYRLRIGDYRVVYEPDSDQRVIVVHYVRHRRDVYRAI